MGNLNTAMLTVQWGLNTKHHKGPIVSAFHKSWIKYLSRSNSGIFILKLVVGIELRPFDLLIRLTDLAKLESRTHFIDTAKIKNLIEKEYLQISKWLVFAGHLSASIISVIISHYIYKLRCCMKLIIFPILFCKKKQSVAEIYVRTYAHTHARSHARTNGRTDARTNISGPNLLES